MLRSTDLQPLISSRTSRPHIAWVGTKTNLGTYQATHEYPAYDPGSPADIRYILLLGRPQLRKSAANDLIPANALGASIYDF